MNRIFMSSTLAMLVLFAGCYKSELSNTVHPEQGKVEVEVKLPTVTPESDESSDPEAVHPEDFTVSLGDEEMTVSKDGSVQLPSNLEEGEYTVYVYSNTENVDVENNSTLTGGGTIVSSTVVDAGEINSLTEDLYFGTQTITVLSDQIVSSKVELSQVTRTIKFNLFIEEGDKDKVADVKAYLNGIAQQWECISDEPIGESVAISPSFIQGESLTKAEAENDHLISAIKVLGINGDTQELTLVLTFENGNMQTISSDVSEQLAGSNKTKEVPVILSGNIKLNTEFGATGTITDWEVSGNDYDFDANQPNQ